MADDKESVISSVSEQADLRTHVELGLAYRDAGLFSDAITELKEFPGRSHYTLGQEGWEEVADFALAWALDPVAIPV